MSRVPLTLNSFCTAVLAFLIGMSALSFVLPLASRPMRGLMVLTAFLVLVYVLIRLIRLAKSRLRFGGPALGLLTVLLVVFAVFLRLGNRPPDTDALRSTYVRRLNSFRGVMYIWGGENHVGIDCSGLARTAMCEAILQRGLASHNPRLLGPTLWRFWWRDMSARAMLEQVYGYTRPVGHAIQLSEPDALHMERECSLREGDLAVTDNGVHVLIYVGNGDWIEANPDDGRVVVNKAEGSSRAYFSMPVTVLRWWILEDGT